MFEGTKVMILDSNIGFEIITLITILVIILSAFSQNIDVSVTMCLCWDSFTGVYWQRD